MKTLLIALSLATAVLAASQQDVRGSIQITVKDKLTGEGLLQAEVTLIPPQNAGISSTPKAGADANGVATFTALPLGRYLVRVQKPGYVSATPNALGQVATATATLDAEHRTQAVVIEMTQATSIAGKVKGPDGRPIAGITINPALLVFQAGYPSLSRVATAVTPQTGTTPQITQVTNNDGEYLLSGLPPGQYYLRAEYRPSVSTAGALAARISYFPGTADSAAAAPVVVHERENLTGIDFQVPSIPNVKVTGKIAIKVPNGCGVPVGGDYPVIATFFAATRNPAALDREPAIVANAADPKSSTKDTVAFELRNMPPGLWDLYPLCGTSGGGPNYTSRTPIEIRDRDIENLAIEIHPYLEVRGRLNAKDGVGPIPMERVGVEMRLIESVPSLIGSRGFGAAARGQRPQVDAAGLFSVPDLLQARYAPVVTGLPAGMYLAEVRIGGQPSNSGVVLIQDSASSLELTVASGTMTVQGVVWTNNKQPFPRAAVVLVPEQSKRVNPVLYKRTTSGDNGRFTFTNVEPGEYKVFAWQTAPAGRAEENAQFMSKFELSGKPVSIKPGVPPSDVQIDLIPD